MSKRAELHKEYYKQFGKRKGTSKVSEHYVKWLEDKVLELRTVYVTVKSDECKSQDVGDFDKIIVQICRI